MLLKPAQPEDIPLITTMMAEYYAMDGLDFEAEAATQAVQNLMEEPAFGYAYLIQHEGQSAGYLVMTFWYSLEFRGRSAFIDEIYLRPDFRNLGLGSQVIESVSSACKAQGIKTLRLEVEHENTRAQAVYRKNGFEAHPRDLMTKWL